MTAGSTCSKLTRPQANILIDSECRPRLADFGLARIIEDSCNSSTQGGQKGGGGTVRWSAPECLHPERFGFSTKSRKRLPSKSTDIYALGMTILEASTSSVPQFIHRNSRTSNRL